MTGRHQDTSDAVGRVQEVERIVRFLQIRGGGSLLLGGDRGSGKTKLINMAVDQYAGESGASKHQRILNVLPRYARALTMARIIKIHIPLIILESKEDKIKNEYRSMLMRAMLIGLEADLSRRYYSKLDLPKRWFSAIGYVQKVYSMSHYAHYLKLNKSSSKSLGMMSGFPITPALQTAINADIDLTDSTLEIKMRNLLTEYSKIHNFIFIFDELDKLPVDIELETIVLYLKNLFTETGVHAIFISSEKDLKRVIKKSSNETTPREESTLFIDLILLNNMRLDDLSKLIRERVAIDDDNPNADMNELIYGLALRTNKSPNELNKFLTRHGIAYKALIHGLKTELGNEKFSKFAVMQVFISYTHNSYSGLYDEHFDRVLEGALQQVGTILLESDSTLMHDVQTDTIFYSSDYFNAADLTPTQALSNEKIYKQNREKYVPSSKPDILKKMDDLNSDQYVSILFAIEHLIILLNRTGQLVITATDTSTVVKLNSISESTFTHSKIGELNFSESFELTEIEQDTLSIIKRYNPPYQILTDNNIYGSTYIVEDDGTQHSLETPSGLYTFSNSRLYWSQMQGIASKAQENLLKAMFTYLQSRLGAAAHLKSISYKNKTATITLQNDSQIKLILLFENQRFNIDTSAIKTFVFRDTEALFRHRNVVKAVKNLPMKKNWTNIKSSLNAVAKWIDENASRDAV